MSKVHIEMELDADLPDTPIAHQLIEELRAEGGRKALETKVLEYYQDGKLSTEAAAEMLGMPLWEFIPFLGKHGISIYDDTEEETLEGIKAVEQEVQRLKAGNRDYGSQ
jgi:predicted HTH domain antitoxin